MAKALRLKRSLTPNPYYNRGNGGLSAVLKYFNHILVAADELAASDSCQYRSKIYLSLKLGLLKVGKGDSEEVHFTED